MQVEIDPGAGFCFGVKNAVSEAEKVLKESGRLYCLGEIVHNESELERLEKMGLQTITANEFDNLSGETVLIRAHGEPPETYEKARERNIKLIDATCPVVSRLQDRVKTCFDEIDIEKGQIVIFGKTGHPEVNGLLGQTKGKGIIINNLQDADQLDFTKTIYLYAQTTKSKKDFYTLKTAIEKKIKEKNLDTRLYLMAHDTICGQVSKREPKLREFATKHDLIIFVSGQNSSNGKTLFAVCKQSNPNSFFVSGPGEINDQVFDSAKSVGISGATSTPAWLLEDVYKRIIQIAHD